MNVKYYHIISKNTGELLAAKETGEDIGAVVEGAWGTISVTVDIVKWSSTTNLTKLRRYFQHTPCEVYIKYKETSRTGWSSKQLFALHGKITQEGASFAKAAES